MKKLIPFAVMALLVSCSGSNSTNGEENAEPAGDSAAVVVEEQVYPYHAGEEFDISKAISEEELAELVANFEGDSTQVVIKSVISASCKKKGCWMRVAAGDQEIMVRFKDYDFFVPLDAAGHTVIVNGYLYNDTISVEQLRHYAMDANASEDSIQSITEPRITLAYEATGVYVE